MEKSDLLQNRYCSISMDSNKLIPLERSVAFFAFAVRGKSPLVILQLLFLLIALTNELLHIHDNSAPTSLLRPTILCVLAQIVTVHISAGTARTARWYDSEQRHVHGSNSVSCEESRGRMLSRRSAHKMHDQRTTPKRSSY